jgi:hypothetical protein
VKLTRLATLLQDTASLQQKPFSLKKGFCLMNKDSTKHPRASKKRGPGTLRAGGRSTTPDQIEKEIRRRVEAARAQIASDAADAARLEEGKSYESQGRWDGSEKFRLLTEAEVKYATLNISEDFGGVYYCELFFLLIQHLAKLAFEKRFHDLEFAVCTIQQEAMHRGPVTADEGIDLPGARKRLDGMLTWFLSSEAHSQTEELTKHIEATERRERDEADKSKDE